MVKTKKVNLNDYYWNELHGLYVNKKLEKYFYDYHGHTYDVNGELIAIRRRIGYNDKWYWGSIDDAGEDWKVKFIYEKSDGIVDKRDLKLLN